MFWNSKEQQVTGDGPISADMAKKLSDAAEQDLLIKNRQEVFKQIKDSIKYGYKITQVYKSSLFDKNRTFFEGLGYKVEDLLPPTNGQAINIINGAYNYQQYVKISWE